MTGPELVDTLAKIGWSNSEFGRRIGITEGQIRRWTKGQYQMPAKYADWLTGIAAYLDAHPAP